MSGSTFINNFDTSTKGDIYAPIINYTGAVSKPKEKQTSAPGDVCRWGGRCVCGKCSGCFSGDDNVLMHDETTKKVRDLNKGDVVWGGATVQIKVVIHRDSVSDMVTLPNNGPTLTAYHPVYNRSQMKWMFPIEIAPINEDAASWEVFNFVLSGFDQLTVNGYDCITLAHGNTTNRVLKHPYYGTHRVIQDITSHPKYDAATGIIHYVNPVISRDENGLVCKVE